MGDGEGMKSVRRSSLSTILLKEYNDGESGILFGGYKGDKERLNDVHLINFANFCWSTLHTLNPPSPRNTHTAEVVGRHLIVFGGRTESQFFSEVHVLDLDSNKWSEMATTGDTPAPRSGHSMVVYQNSLIIFGGWSGSYRRYNDVHQLSLETRTWVKHQPSGPIPKQRSFPFSLLSLLLPLFVYPASTFILLIVLYHFYLSLCYHQMNP